MSIKKYIKRGLTYLFKGVPNYHVTANIVSLASNDYLKGRTALITGGGSGIGLAIADAFMKAGADVVITGRNKDKLEKACKQLVKDNSGRKAMFHEMDVRNVEDITNAFSEIKFLQGLNRMDILVNNAGVIGSFGISTTDENTFDTVLSTNLKGPFFLSSLFGQYMIENKIKGNILNIASSSSLRPANSVYGISKWGIRGFTLGLAKSLLPYGIIVNALAPGPTATQMILDDPQKGIERDGLLGRHIMPEEIANMAVILTSSLGRTIIGDCIYMTAGSGVLTFDDIPCKF